MRLAIDTQVLRLPLRDPFRIARDEDDRQATTVIVEVTADGLTGLGEAFPVAYYGETVGTIGVMVPLLAEAVGTLEEPPTSVEAARAWLIESARLMGRTIGGHGGAKAGLDIALHDLVARGLGVPLHELLGT
jgi:L-alanine-DL-glutamate epimerase-like enolase superfamily enzyme